MALAISITNSVLLLLIGVKFGVAGSAGLTVTTTSSLSAAPSLSVTIKVTVCSPIAKSLFVKFLFLLSTIPFSLHT